MVYDIATNFLVAMDAELPLEAALPTIWQECTRESAHFREVNEAEIHMITTDAAFATEDLMYEDDQYVDEVEL